MWEVRREERRSGGGGEGCVRRAARWDGMECQQRRSLSSICSRATHPHRHSRHPLCLPAAVFVVVVAVAFCTLSGQQTIRSYWRNYYEQTDGLMFVIDSADVRRMEICKSELHQLLRQEKLAGASLLIFANKQDLSGALSREEIAQVLDLETLGETGRHWRIVGCSAWTGDGLIEGVDWIVNDIAGRIYMME